MASGIDARAVSAEPAGGKADEFAAGRAAARNPEGQQRGHQAAKDATFAHEHHRVGPSIRARLDVWQANGQSSRPHPVRPVGRRGKRSGARVDEWTYNSRGGPRSSPAPASGSGAP